MVSLGPVLDRFSAVYGVEACDVVGVNGNGRHAVELYTLKAAATCVLFKRRLPEGFQDTGLSIHSHPASELLRVTAVDQLLRTMAGLERLDSVVKNTGKTGFSDHDYHSPGYLVAGGKIWSQTGPGTSHAPPLEGIGR